MYLPENLPNKWGPVRLDEDDQLIYTVGRYQLYSVGVEIGLILYDKTLCRSWGILFLPNDDAKEEIKIIKRWMRQSQKTGKQLTLF